MEYKIDFSVFEKSIASLEDILKQPLDEYRRDGTIQRFEYTFELAWKMIQRVLKVQGIDEGSPKQVFRAAFKAHLIDDIEAWFRFLEQRNLTTHTYDQETAEEVFETAKAFPKYAKNLLQNLKKEIENK